MALGAFGAHALAGALDPRARELWETASRYLIGSALGGIALSTAAATLLDGRGGAAIDLVLGGGALFSATLYGLALGAPRSLGAVTPIGGGAMILGFTLFALSASRFGRD